MVNKEIAKVNSAVHGKHRWHTKQRIAKYRKDSSRRRKERGRGDESGEEEGSVNRGM